MNWFCQNLHIILPQFHFSASAIADASQPARLVKFNTKCDSSIFAARSGKVQFAVNCGVALFVVCLYSDGCWVAFVNPEF